RQSGPSWEPRRDQRLCASFDSQSVRSGPRANGHQSGRDSDLVAVRGSRAGGGGNAKGHTRRRPAHSVGNHHFADTHRTDRNALVPLPAGQWHHWEPAVGDGAREGAKLAFGAYVNTVYRPGKADVILSLDSDFLASGPGHIRYAREFYERRKLNGPGATMNRLYIVEPTPSVTGASADHR